VVAAAMNVRTFTISVAAAVALGFLVVMVVTGALPQQKQFVKFEAKGVMQLPPEQVNKVAIRSGDLAGLFVRTGDTWSSEAGKPLDEATSKHLSMAVQFMNTSGPVRVLTPDEYKGTDAKQFGLDEPRLSIVLFEGERPVLGAHFGGRNPDGMLEYVMVEGRRELFLLSRFVGEEWDAAAKGALRPSRN
jgi:hypothetical protein